MREDLYMRNRGRRDSVQNPGRRGEVRGLDCSAPHYRRSLSVVRVSCQDLLSAVELLEQHAADKQMRPGHRAEGQNRVGAVENRGVQTIGASDSEGQLGDPLVAPGGDAVSEHPTRPRRAASVECDKTGA